MLQAFSDFHRLEFIFLLAREYAFDKCNNLLPEMVWHDVGKRLKQIIQQFYRSSEFR